MNKNEEIVIRYLSGDLSGIELETFELNLSSSDDLKKMVNDYSLVFNSVSEQKSIKTNYFYFENILPRFYNRKKSNINAVNSRNIVYASVVAIFLLVGYFFFSGDEVGNINDIEIITQEISPDQIREIIDDYSLVDNSNLNSIGLNSIIDEQLNSFYNNSAEKISMKLEVDDLTNQLTEAEIEKIYSELINKKIL